MSFFSLLRKEILGSEIIRRYVIINTFDGALTILGIIAASWFAGIQDAAHLILPSIGAGIAMCVSGVWGAYAAEAAELKREVKALEKHLLRRLTGTHIDRRIRRTALIVGIVDGAAPLIATFFIIIPFFLEGAGMFGMDAAYGIAVGLCATVLVLLGVFAGKIAHESILRHSLRMLFAGLIIAAIFFALELVGLL